MSRRARRNHTPAFKAKVALAAIKGDRTLAQLSEQFDVHLSLHTMKRLVQSFHAAAVISCTSALIQKGVRLITTNGDETKKAAADGRWRYVMSAAHTWFGRAIVKLTQQ